MSNYFSRHQQTGTVIRCLAILFLSLLLGACGTMTFDRTYIRHKGTDAGLVVIGMGATLVSAHYSSYTFKFRKVDGSGGMSSFVYVQSSPPDMRQLDYLNETEAGVVFMYALEPGDYEIYVADTYLNGGVQQFHYYPPKPFSIPFTVRTKETTYLGNFQANKIYAKNLLGMRVPAGSIYLISDRQQSELDIVKQRSPEVSLGPISNQVPSVSLLANPSFRSAGTPVNAAP